jgi:hypothetical protein
MAIPGRQILLPAATRPHAFLESQPWKRVKTGKAQQQNNGLVVTRGWIWRIQSDHSEQSDLIIIISD